MDYITLEFKDETHVFALNKVSLRRLPLDKGHWDIKKGVRTFHEKYYVYVINDPEAKRFELPIYGIRLFEGLTDLLEFLKGKSKPLAGRLLSKVSEDQWPDAPPEIANTTSLPLTHPKYKVKST